MMESQLSLSPIIIDCGRILHISFYRPDIKVINNEFVKVKVGIRKEGSDDVNGTDAENLIIT